MRPAEQNAWVCSWLSVSERRVVGDPGVIRLHGHDGQGYATLGTGRSIGAHRPTSSTVHTPRRRGARMLRAAHTQPAEGRADGPAGAEAANHPDPVQPRQRPALSLRPHRSTELGGTHHGCRKPPLSVRDPRSCTSVLPSSASASCARAERLLPVLFLALRRAPPVLVGDPASAPDRRRARWHDPVLVERIGLLTLHPAAVAPVIAQVEDVAELLAGLELPRDLHPATTKQVNPDLQSRSRHPTGRLAATGLEMGS
jgi:hypothetical protein